MTVSQPAELLRNSARNDIPSTSLQYKQCIWVELLTMWQLPGAKTVAFGLASTSALRDPCPQACRFKSGHSGHQYQCGPDFA
jgi:hypothetical protein